jgi:hypothetical protein
MSTSPTPKECFFFFGNFGTMGQKKIQCQGFFWKIYMPKVPHFEKKYLILKSPYLENT